MKESKRKVNQYCRLLEAVNESQSIFYQQGDFRKLLNELLEKILILIDSRVGFMAEVLYDKQRIPYLKSHAITNIFYSEDTESFCQQNFQAGIEFRNLDTLFGHSVLTGELVIANDAARDSRSGEISIGQTPLHRYLGIPVFKEKELLGLVGFANKQTDYTDEDVKLLEPLISCYANLIKRIRIERGLEESRKEEVSNLNKIIFENSNDIFAVHNLDMTISYISPSVKKILGYSQDEMFNVNPMNEGVVIKSSGDINDFEREVLVTVVYQHKYANKKVYLEVQRKPLKNKQGETYAVLTTSRDVTERELILEKLIKSYEKEKEINTLKSTFISMASHELRTPMSTIFSSNELIEFYLMEIHDKVIREKGQQHVKRISTQVNRLSMIINDVMLLEKNADGKIRVVQKELELVGFIRDFARDFSNNYLPGRPVKLLLPSGKKTVKTDHRLLYHIVSNLVDNACKYSSQSERCPEIKLSYMEDSYCFCVTDYGIGIPKEDQKFVFDFFFRSKNVSTIQGTGLGLNIVSAIVSKLNGTISFSSDEGIGSTFNLTLPYDIS